MADPYYKIKPTSITLSTVNVLKTDVIELMDNLPPGTRVFLSTIDISFDISTLDADDAYADLILHSGRLSSALSGCEPEGANYLPGTKIRVKRGVGQGAISGNDILFREFSDAQQLEIIVDKEGKASITYAAISSGCSALLAKWYLFLTLLVVPPL